MNYVSQNILDGLSILSAGQLAVPDLLPRLSVIGSWSKGKVPRLERHRPVETIDSSCAPINSNWAGRFFPGVGPNPKESPFQLGPVHKGRGADCNGGMMDQCVGTRSQNKQLCCREDHLSTRIALDQAALGAGLGGGCNIWLGRERDDCFSEC